MQIREMGSLEGTCLTQPCSSPHDNALDWKRFPWAAHTVTQTTEIKTDREEHGMLGHPKCLALRVLERWRAREMSGNVLAERTTKVSIQAIEEKKRCRFPCLNPHGWRWCSSKGLKMNGSESWKPDSPSYHRSRASQKCSCIFYFLSPLSYW